jgi:hypothetical protein
MWLNILMDDHHFEQHHKIEPKQTSSTKCHAFITDKSAMAADYVISC